MFCKQPPCNHPELSDNCKNNMLKAIRNVEQWPGNHPSRTLEEMYKSTKTLNCEIQSAK